VLTSIFSSTTINTEFSGAAIGDEIMRSAYDFLDYILLSLALSISLAVIFAVRQRQNGRPIIWWQIALITLFGPPAFVAIVWTTPVTSKKFFSGAYPLLGTEILA